MEQLKTKVVMLLTNQKAEEYNKTLVLDGQDELSITSVPKDAPKHIINSWLNIANKYTKPQYLYFISDREIKEGDWCISKFFTEDKAAVNRAFYLKVVKLAYIKKGEYYFHCQDNDNPNLKASSLEHFNKIEASTNPELNLPKPSDSFIAKYVERYNSGKPIEYCLVEMEEDNILMNSHSQYKRTSVYTQYNGMKIKTREDNTIITKSIKDSWNREEYIKCAEFFYTLGREEARLSSLEKKYIDSYGYHLNKRLV